MRTHKLVGHQLQVFNSQSQIQIGGKWSKGKSRIERPFIGSVAGVVVNGMRILDLAAEKDIHTSIRGDVQLIAGILDRQDQLQKMQQVQACYKRSLKELKLSFLRRKTCKTEKKIH